MRTGVRAPYFTQKAIHSRGRYLAPSGDSQHFKALGKHVADFVAASDPGITWTLDELVGLPRFVRFRKLMHK